MWRILAAVFVGLSSVNGLQNVAIDKKASQSGTRYAASRAIDGNTNQNFYKQSCSETSAWTDPWWKVDLGDIYNIENIKIYNRMDCCTSRLHHVHLYTGFSNSDYDLRGYREKAIGSTYIFEIPALVHGRWVRIYRKGTGGYLHMCEVQVYGSRKTQNKMRFHFVPNAVGTGNILKSTSATSSVHCCSLCYEKFECAAVNYHNDTGMCDLLGRTSSMTDMSGSIRFYRYP